jgi:hypothetical protein
MPTSCGSTIESPPPETTKLLVTAQQMVDATVFMANTNQTPTALRPLQEDPHRAATTNRVAAVVDAAAAAAEAPPTALAEELVAATITEAEAT